MNTETKNIITSSVRIGWILLFVIMGCLWGCPQYRIYQQRAEGEAELSKANYSKQVSVQDALAKRDAATLLAQADTIRAHGVARSNEIIGMSLKNNEAYLHWLWIDNLEKNPNAVIYVPTEANLPILEAGRNRIPYQSPKPE